MNYDQQKDEQLWQTAKARASFRWSLLSYLVINSFLVGIWLFTSKTTNHFWPIWSILGWGLGLAFQYFRAYHGNQQSMTQQEYEKLKQEENSRS